MFVSLILALSVPAVQVEQVNIDSDARRMFLMGLERKLGGKFIISGLGDAEAECRETKSCIAADDVIGQFSNDARVSSLKNLLDRTNVSGERPIAIVSLRNVSRTASSYKIGASLYEPKVGRWQNKIARVRMIGKSVDASSPLIRLTEWYDEPDKKL
ncbi:hypothetical protein GCM10022268_27140 [Sphingomonas cynarae]|uniref:Uncharacterized protein n=1 Tax=Sphingomonas cynarae TaxID=930197 RepID=A0ABP7EEC7_9SPHN